MNHENDLLRLTKAHQQGGRRALLDAFIDIANDTDDQQQLRAAAVLVRQLNREDRARHEAEDTDRLRAAYLSGGSDALLSSLCALTEETDDRERLWTATDAAWRIREESPGAPSPA